MTSPLLSLRNADLSLRSNAGDVNILRDISLDVHAGETIGVTGPSGSGKSSLLMLMGGLERATGGTVTALGQDLGQLGEDALARLRRDNIGVVFQSFHLIPTLTALENVATPLDLAGTPDAEARAEAELRAVGLAHRMHHYPAQMSGGEQQLLLIGRAMMAKPKIIAIDEPSLGLAPMMIRDVYDVLKQLKSEGTTFFLVEQNSAAALSIADYAYVMENGRIVMDGPADKLADNEDIKEFYLGVTASGERKSYRDIKHYRRRKRWLG